MSCKSGSVFGLPGRSYQPSMPHISKQKIKDMNKDKQLLSLLPKVFLKCCSYVVIKGIRGSLDARFLSKFTIEMHSILTISK